VQAGAFYTAYISALTNTVLVQISSMWLNVLTAPRASFQRLPFAVRPEWSIKHGFAFSRRGHWFQSALDLSFLNLSFSQSIYMTKANVLFGTFVVAYATCAVMFCLERVWLHTRHVL
jgi:hypothetical protein